MSFWKKDKDDKAKDYGENQPNTAIEIYNNFYSNLEPKKIDKTKNFFNELRRAIVDEYKRNGTCELIEALLKNQSDIDRLMRIVILDISSYYENNYWIDLDNEYKLPHYKVNDERLPWDSVDIFKSAWDKEDSKKILLDIDHESKKHFKYIEDKPYDFSASPEIKSAMDSKKIIEEAHVQADNFNNYINNQKSIIDEENAEAERQIEEAHTQADKIIEKAHAQAREIIAHANNQKSIIDKEKAEAERQIEEAYAQADKIINDAKKDAQDKSEKLVAHYLMQEQKEYKAELNNEMQKFTDLYEETTRKSMNVHSDMCDRTNAYQVKFIESLNETINKLEGAKSEFYTHLHNWQSALSSNEIKPLAERYVELYQIINVDKLLREEILFGELSDGKNEISEVCIEGLHKLNKTLTIFLRRFEIALAGMNLYVYYPKQGEAFDEIWHICNDDEQDCSNKRIKECIIPGIAKRIYDDLGDDVIIQAVVTVETES